MIKPDGELHATPGIMPAWQAFWSGQTREAIESLMAPMSVTGHAVLGSGPMQVVLYKSTDLLIVMKGKTLVSAGPDPEYENNDFYPVGVYCATMLRLKDQFDLSVIWVCTDNYYQYVELREDSGDTWHGFSGYEVGPGFSQPENLVRTAECERKLAELFQWHLPPDEYQTRVPPGTSRVIKS